MTSAPLSVVIPARNAAATIGATLEDLAGARDLIMEVVVVDDGSTDATAAVAGEAAAKAGLPLKMIPGPARGVSGARNAGLDVVTGPLVYMVDADDRVFAGGLRALVDAMARDPAAVLAVGTGIDNVNGVRRAHRPTPFASTALANAEAYVAGRRPLFRMGTVLVRRAPITTLRFPAGLVYQEDGIFWARALLSGRAITVDATVFEYVIDRSSSAGRLTDDHRAKFLRVARELRALRSDGLGAAAIRRGIGESALVVGRALIAVNARSARRYLHLSWAASRDLDHRYAVAKARLKLALASTKRR